MECATCKGKGEILKEYSKDEFEDYLNDSYPEVSICGMMMQQGTILREMDSIAFNCAIADTEEYEKCEDCDGSGEIEEEAEING